jgi:Ras-related protein Rab-1A
VGKRRLFKIILIGEGRVGKTSIRKRYFGQKLEQEYLVTIGADFSLKRIGNNAIQIWDLAGQNLYRSIRKNYYLGAHGVILVFDVVNRESFEKLPVWIDEMNQFIGKAVPVALVGNKIDLIDKTNGVIKDYEALEFCEEYEMRDNIPFEYFRTSALTGENIDELFERLIERISEED